MLVDLDWQPFEPEGFPGVSVELCPLTTLAFQQFGGVLNAESSAAKANTLLDVAREVFPKHVRNVCGLEVRVDGSKRAATVEDIMTRAPFYSLLSAIVARLVSISILTEAEAKNSKPVSDNSGRPEDSGSRANG